MSTYSSDLHQGVSNYETILLRVKLNLSPANVKENMSFNQTHSVLCLRIKMPVIPFELQASHQTSEDETWPLTRFCVTLLLMNLSFHKAGFLGKPVTSQI